jgi:hypothetical protein
MLEVADRTLGGTIMKTPDKDERRGSGRFPMESEVQYKLLNSRGNDITGVGKLLNMSSNGVLFSTDAPVAIGHRIEWSISWPAQLNSKIPLKMVARGRVVRSSNGVVAAEIQQHEFRTAKAKAQG